MARNVGFHLTLTEPDRELLDRLAARMGRSRTDVIGKALHLLEAVQTRGPVAPAAAEARR